MKLAVTPEEQRAWAAQWKKAAIALDAVKSEELRMLTDEQARAASEMLLSAVTFPRPDRIGGETSGLVEQQRLFAKVKY